MKKGVLYFLIGGFFYICLVLLWVRQYSLITVDAKEIMSEYSNIGLIPFIQEDTESDYNVLHDNIIYIAEVNDEMEDSENITEDYSEDSGRNDVSEDSEENAETMNDYNAFQIMVVFCFGLCAGVVVGHFLTGFIR